MLKRYLIFVLSGMVTAGILSSCQVKKAKDILSEIDAKVVATSFNEKINPNFSEKPPFVFSASDFSQSPFYTGRVNGFSDFIDEKTFNKQIDYPVDNKYLSPLSLVDLSKIKLVGTIVSGDERLALIEYAGKVFFMRKGDRLGKGDGRVTFVGDDMIYVYQQKDDGTGSIAHERVIIRTSVTKEDRGNTIR